jgi:hypothetical protein
MPELYVSQSEFRLEQRKNGKDRLPVCIVEKAGQPEHSYNPPPVSIRAHHALSDSLLL